MIAQLLSGGRAPRDVGEGLHAIGRGLQAAVLGSRADAEEKAGNAERARIMGGIGFGGAPMAAVGGAPVASGSAAPRAVAAPEQFAALFAEQEAKYGLPQGYLARTAQIESNFNPNAKNPNSSAGGLFQFINSTARQYGLANRFDPVAATASAARLASDNRDFLARRLGREPSAGELYLAHQQGAGGAAKLLANPNASASSVVGDAAARLNRGAGMTANAFANQWINKFGTPVVRPGPGATPMPLAQPIQTASAGPQGNEAQMQDGAGELQAGGSGLMAEPAVYRGELNNVPAGDLMQRGPMPALPEGFDVSSLITPAGQPSGAQGIADNEEQTRIMEAQMAAEQGLPYAGNEPGTINQSDVYSPIPMGFGRNPFLPYEPDAMAQAPAAPAPSMNRATFDQVTAGLDPRAPTFTGRNAGIAPSWGIGDPDAPAPDAQEVSVRPARDTVSLPAANIQPPQSPAMRAPLPVDMGGENSGGSAMQFIESEFARREGRPDPRMAVGAPQGYNPFVPQALQAPQMAGDGGSVQGASQGGALAGGAAQPQQAGMITPQNVRAVMSSPFTSDADKRFVMDMWNQQQARTQAEAERQRVQAQNDAAADALKIDRRLGGVSAAVAAAAKANFDRKFGQAKRSLQPVYGTDAQGNTVVLQLGDDGTVSQSQLPKDVKIASGVDRIDAGTKFLLQDKRTGAIVGEVPKDIAGAERAKVIGKDEGERVVNAPAEQRVAEGALKTLEQIKTHPGREGWGAQGPTAALPWISRAVPGTPGRDFVALVEQAQGQAFLQAFESLKGGGAITEAEGKAATAAIARLDRTQSRQGFDAALKDIQTMLETARDRARRNVRVTPDGTEVPAGPAAPAAPGASKVLRYNPKTGALE